MRVLARERWSTKKMLSASHKKAYQELLTLLTEFKEKLKVAPAELNIATAKEDFQQLQRHFEEKISTLSENNLAANIAPRWLAIQRELSREFRLLTTDIIILASSRQTATKEARLQGISDRLDKLTEYCQAAIAI